MAVGRPPVHGTPDLSALVEEGYYVLVARPTEAPHAPRRDATALTLQIFGRKSFVVD